MSILLQRRLVSTTFASRLDGVRETVSFNDPFASASLVDKDTLPSFSALVEGMEDWQPSYGNHDLPCLNIHEINPVRLHERAPLDALDAWQHSRTQICVPQEIYHGPMSNSGPSVAFEPSWSGSKGAPMDELLLETPSDRRSKGGKFHIPRRSSLSDPDQEVMEDVSCPIISFGIYWPGHKPWSKTIPVRDASGARITRHELATLVALEYRAFFQAKRKTRFISTEGETWASAMDVSRLRIVKLWNPDGDANWHAELAFVCDF